MTQNRENWPIPPAITSNPPIKIEPQPQELATPSATAAPKAGKCGWGPNCPICKNIEEEWDGDHQKQFQQNVPSTQPQSTQQPQMPGLQCPQPKIIKNHKIYSISKQEIHNTPSHKLPVLLVTNI